MSRLEARPSAGDIAQLTEAVQAGDWSRAQRAMSACGPALPAEALRAAAAVHSHFERWAEALRLLNRLIDRQITDEMNRTLARNMVALQKHRPAAYRAVMATSSAGQYQITAGAGGRPIIVAVAEDGRRLSLSQNADPLQAVSGTMAQLQDSFEQASALGLCGLGDGYLLSTLARTGRPLSLGQLQPIYLIEPDGLLVRVAMMIHDYSGPTGPIEQRRFLWFIGPDWDDQFARTFGDDLYLDWPKMTISQSPQAPAIKARMAELGEQHNQRMHRWTKIYQDYYRQMGRQALVALLGEAPPRRPRVLVLTTRFSTVLQHSSRDVAWAFERLGWSSRLLIEPADDRRHTPASLKKAMADFQPDLVFQIDHLRCEYENIFPPALPFVCWIQDHLANLLNAEAGRLVGRRDFVLTAVRPMYVDRYGYPDRQCIDLPKLTRQPVRPARWTSDGDDLVFVSNASGVPQRLAAELVENCPTEEVAAMMEQICRALIAEYQQGRCVSTRHDFQHWFEQIEQTCGQEIGGPGRDLLMREIFNRLNNALYRQQALHWALDIARRRGLTLALYGRGWEDHPDFAAHARGPVAYGAALEELTRRSKINLQIVPYGCFHQRLFDGLVAGGFFLVRRHPFDAAAVELAAFLDRHVGDAATSVASARQMVAPAHRPMLDELLARHACLGYECDPIALLRCWRSAGLLEWGQPLMPGFDEVAFDGPASLEQRIERYLADESLRRAVAGPQRRWVERRLTYQAGLRRVIERIRALIESESEKPT